MKTPSAAAGRGNMPRPALEPGVLPALGLLAVTLVGLVVASRIAFGLFYAAGAALLAALAYLSYRVPRAALIAVVFTPIVDRYLVSLLIPESLHGVTNYLSEALLLLVAVSIGVRAWRDGTLAPALRHPVVAFVAAFVGIGVVSAVVNGVPPLIALAGIVFTVEAVALFVLPRAVGMTLGHARLALVGFTALATVAALLALGQVLLHADFLGMQSFSGRFNEGRRVAAFLVNPNMLGVVLAMAIPLPLLAATSSGGWRGRIGWGTLTFVLALALLYTFSRGAWLGLAAAAVLIGLFLDPKALILLVLVGFLSYASAVVLPRHVLEPDPGDVGFDLGAATVGRLDTISEGGDLRVLFIENGAPIIADHPIIGAGPGRYGGAVAWRFGSPLYDQYTAGSVPRERTVDNFWLHMVVEFGLLGSLIFASAIAVAVRRTIADARLSDRWPALIMGSAAAIAVIVGVDSISEMLLEGNTTSFPVWFFLGVASVLGASGAAVAAGAREP